jgi:hypothetical protein
MFEPVPFYCEENVWMFLESLCAAPRSNYGSARDAFAVFISNPHGHVAFRHQVNREGLDVLCWDYHAVALVRENGSWFIKDFNCDLGSHSGKNDWIKKSFYPEPVDETFSPLFKLVPRARYLEYFVSDRSHMIGNDGVYAEPPPEWPAIGKGASNLSRFVDMNDVTDGEVYSLEDFSAATTFACGRCIHRRAPQDDALPS